MLNYLKEFVNLILSGTTKNSGPLKEQVRQVYQEVNRLDIRGFEPSAQFSLLKVRAQLAHFAENTGWSAGPMMVEVAASNGLEAGADDRRSRTTASAHQLCECGLAPCWIRTRRSANIGDEC